MTVGIHRRERRVEGPPGIDTAGEERVKRHRAAQQEEVPTGEVQAWKGEIAGADHQRHHEVAECGRDGWNEEEPDHHHAMHREQPVIDVGADEVALRRRQFEPDHGGRRAADEEEERDRREIEEGDALVIGRE
jgi:hypothetical protein